MALLTYRRPHLCVVRRHERPSPAGVHLATNLLR